jgi:hypothetical protein
VLPPDDVLSINAGPETFDPPADAPPTPTQFEVEPHETLIRNIGDPGVAS